MSVTDTHTYDGQLNQLPELSEIQLLSIIQKKERGQELLELIDQNKALYLRDIISNMGSSVNFDPTNNLWADDLISLCWVYRHNPYFITELEIQLTDMSTGFCPQGRTHRLYQIILPFI